MDLRKMKVRGWMLFSIFLISKLRCCYYLSSPVFTLTRRFFFHSRNEIFNQIISSWLVQFTLYSAIVRSSWSSVKDLSFPLSTRTILGLVSFRVMGDYFLVSTADFIFCCWLIRLYKILVWQPLIAFSCHGGL